ncbi:MAG: glycosyltransferase family 2 protein, partial [Ruminiclostridium sp.]|nr:glycosyltransferase family 2 protein [Ruminiclostridium sp.]
MKITVYTRAYNAEKYISKCVESVLEQSFRDFEYFIVDNGSTDGTRKLLEDYAKKDGRIRLTRLEKNTRNVTFSYMREFKGELVTQLDADDWWGPGFLERMISFLEKEQLDIAVTGTVNYFEHDGSSRILRKLDQP